MENSPLRPGTDVLVSADGGVEYSGVLAAFNDDFVIIEITKRSPSFRAGAAVTLVLGGRSYESSVTRIDGTWMTLARPDELLGTAARGAVRLAVKALPVAVKCAGERMEGHIVDVSASGARLRLAADDRVVVDATVDATLDLSFRTKSGTARIRRVERAPRDPGDADDAGGDSLHLGLTFEPNATELHRQLIRAMGGVTSDS